MIFKAVLISLAAQLTVHLFFFAHAISLYSRSEYAFCKQQQTFINV